MPEINEEVFKEHLNNLINALYALSPTRNYVLQFLEMLPRDYVKIVEAYPQLFKDEETRQKLKDILGVKISENVEIGYGSIGKALSEISKTIREKFFDRYYWKEFQPKLEKYLNRKLPNVIEELWEQKIQMAISEPTYGDDIKKILFTMVKEGEGDYLKVDLSKMSEITGIEKKELLFIKNFLVKEIGILSPTEEIFEISSADLKSILNKYLGETQ